MKINDLTLPRDLLHEQTVCWPDQGITVMLGQNGVGKSTLLAELARRLPEAAYLPQKNDIYDDISVQAVLALGQQRATQPPSLDVIAAFDLAPLLKMAMRKLSGGQQQRVWLAFMLVQQAPILLLDEPLSALDLRYQKRLTQILVTAQTSVIMIVHDLNYAQRVADWIWVMHEQTILAGMPKEMLTDTLLSAVFQTTIQHQVTVAGHRYFDT
ncbi:ABC transporter ATP-binding protein [Leuconostoc lactis]|uniref:ABC transporter ATP-binding protein n=1 Tax=Leuconostoc lactis TaxID=1246 RepID=UPI000814E72F|nr:ABC transporter ATP-binding protein [Leuconostoc lactis]ANY10963.1 hypothetical protein BCR17_00425 [Leuconostoc lactis]MSB66989.1 ATP-binding cassette domain-containing protein [Leuconostoc lactis]RYS86912.1 ABC transporter ATP-binding protein [Leuconostoc lactis]